jgi:hypothetical protein
VLTIALILAARRNIELKSERMRRGVALHAVASIVGQQAWKFGLY